MCSYQWGSNLPMVLGMKHTHCSPGGMLTRSVIHRLPVCIPIGLDRLGLVTVWVAVRFWFHVEECCGHVR